MALDKATLKASIKSAYKDSTVRGQNAEDSADKLAASIADAIEAYVKSGLVKVTAQSGLIKVQGSAAAQQNTAPIIIEGEVT